MQSVDEVTQDRSSVQIYIQSIMYKYLLFSHKLVYTPVNGTEEKSMDILREGTEGDIILCQIIDQRHVILLTHL